MQLISVKKLRAAAAYQNLNRQFSNPLYKWPYIEEKYVAPADPSEAWKYVVLNGYEQRRLAHFSRLFIQPGQPSRWLRKGDTYGRFLPMDDTAFDDEIIFGNFNIKFFAHRLRGYNFNSRPGLG